jgi:hypothetical protein
MIHLTLRLELCFPPHFTQKISLSSSDSEGKLKIASKTPRNSHSLATRASFSFKNEFFFANQTQTRIQTHFVSDGASLSISNNRWQVYADEVTVVNCQFTFTINARFARDFKTFVCCSEIQKTQFPRVFLQGEIGCYVT